MPRTVRVKPVPVTKEDKSSPRTMRPEVMAAYRRSNEKYRELYKKLAK